MKFWVLIVKKFRKTHLPTDLHDISLDRYFSINWQSIYESVQCRSFYYEILSLIVINKIRNTQISPSSQVISHVHTKNIENDLRILSGLLNTSLKFFCSYFIDLTYNNT